MRRFLKIDFLRRATSQFVVFDEGNVAVEYALMLGLICGCMMSSVNLLGSATTGTLYKIVKLLEPEPEPPTQGTEEAAPVAISISAPMMP